MKNKIVVLAALLSTLGNQNSTAMDQWGIFAPVSSQANPERDAWTQLNTNLKTPWFRKDPNEMFCSQIGIAKYIKKIGEQCTVGCELGTAADKAYEYILAGDYQAAVDVIDRKLETIGATRESIDALCGQARPFEARPEGSLIFDLFKHNLSIIGRLLNFSEHFNAEDLELIKDGLKECAQIEIDLSERYLVEDCSINPDQQQIAEALNAPWIVDNGSLIISSDFFSENLIDRLTGINRELRERINSISTILAQIDVWEELDADVNQLTCEIIQKAEDKTIESYLRFNVQSSNDLPVALGAIQTQTNIFREVLFNHFNIPDSKSLSKEELPGYSRMMNNLIRSGEFFYMLMKTIDLFEDNLHLLFFLTVFEDSIYDIEAVFGNPNSSDKEREEAAEKILSGAARLRVADRHAGL